MNDFLRSRQAFGGARPARALNGGTTRPSGLSGPPRGTVVADAGKTAKRTRATSKAKSSQSPATKEINVVASFSSPFKTTAEEVTAMKENRWEPSTQDFRAVAGDAVTVDNYLQLLAVALVDGDSETANGSIGRINIFTHANSDLIAMKGTIRAGGMTTNVSLDVASAISEDTLDALNQPGVPFNVQARSKKISSKQFTLGDVRKRFAPNAMIVIYACHTGVQGTFLQRIADTFQVRVRGFDDVIGYFPNFEEPDRVTNRRRTGVGHNSQTVGTDFHDLDKSSKVVEKIPRKPASDDD
jgi:hypothetical protein